MLALPKRVQTYARMAEILLHKMSQLVPCQFKKRGFGSICYKGLKMKINPLPSQEYLHQCFEYLEDGKLVRKLLSRAYFATDHAYNTAKRYAGKEAGTDLGKGYRKVRVVYQGENQIFLAHRIIWTMHYGEIPANTEIDHKDTNPANNRIDNLRIASSSKNHCNANLRSDNTSGVKGVFWSKRLGLWRAMIQLNRKKVEIGCFENITDASKAIETARTNLHAEFANHGYN